MVDNVDICCNKCKLRAQNFALVDYIEYQNLIKENIRLATQVDELQKNLQKNLSVSQTCLSCNVYKSSGIKIPTELVTNSEKLKKENDELKKENESLKKRIDVLEKENKELSKRINIIEQENEILKKDKFDRDSEKMYNKYVVAIQDYYKFTQFDNSNMDPSIKELLIELRQDRVQECHYIADKDKEQPSDKYSQYVEVRKMILVNKLCNIPKHIKEMFDAEYPNLIDEITQNIATIPISSIDAHILNKTNKWWSK
jgi:chaperonin cofactor prefoldin